MSTNLFLVYYSELKTGHAAVTELTVCVPSPRVHLRWKHIAFKRYQRSTETWTAGVEAYLVLARHSESVPVPGDQIDKVLMQGGHEAETIIQIRADFDSARFLPVNVVPKSQLAFSIRSPSIDLPIVYDACSVVLAQPTHDNREAIQWLVNSGRKQCSSAAVNVAGVRRCLVGCLPRGAVHVTVTRQQFDAECRQLNRCCPSTSTGEVWSTRRDILDQNAKSLRATRRPNRTSPPHRIVPLCSVDHIQGPSTCAPLERKIWPWVRAVAHCYHGRAHPASRCQRDRLLCPQELRCALLRRQFLLAALKQLYPSNNWYSSRSPPTSSPPPLSHPPTPLSPLATACMFQLTYSPHPSPPLPHPVGSH
eukprot:1534215-Rhodomonas_salina.1